MSSYGGVSPEWHLVKGQKIAALSLAVSTAVEDLPVAAAGLGKQRIGFRPAPDGAGFASSGTVAHLVAGQIQEQVVPELPSGLAVAGLGHGVGKLAEAVEGALETDPLQGHLMNGGRLGHHAPNQIVGDQEGQQFLFDHVRGLAA
jgi:hypothetical protein